MEACNHLKKCIKKKKFSNYQTIFFVKCHPVVFFDETIKNNDYF